MKKEKQVIVFLIVFIGLALACKSGHTEIHVQQEKLDTGYLNFLGTGITHLIFGKKIIKYNHGQLFSFGKDRALQLIPATNKTDTQILIIRMIGEYEYKAQIVNKACLPIDSLHWQPEKKSNTFTLVILHNVEPVSQAR